jgi:uncharacterized protein
VDVSDLYRIERSGHAGRDDGEDAVVLQVHVQPGAGRSAVVGRHGTALKVRVAAAPEGGRANEACAALLGETFGLRASAVELVSGPTSRSKLFRLSGVEIDEFRRQLERAVAGKDGAGPGSAARAAGER